MAILKNLIVNGASRFLQKAYFDDIEVSGTTTISNLSATTLAVSGQTTLNGATDVKNTFNIKNTDHAVNFYFSSTGSAYTSRIYESNPSTGVYQLNVDNNLNVKTNLSASNLIISNKSNFGGKVKVDGDVDILGNLRWSTLGEHVTIQNLGGTFIVAPTILQSNNTEVTITKNSSDGTVTLVIADPAFIDNNDGYYYSGGVNWRVGSKVRLSGLIGSCVLGNSDGTITSVNLGSNNSNGTITINATIANDDSLSNITYAVANGDVSNLSVMLYEVYNNGNTYPVGILMTSYGDNGDQKRSYIDVYGGTAEGTVVRMGNLGGLKYNDHSDPSSVAGEDELPNQWGFFTKGNAYFEGHIKTNAGIIGGWEITSEGLSKGTLGASSGSIYLVPNGKTTTNTIGGSAANLSWTITSNNTFGVTTDGAMYCSSGKIGGWNISATELSYIPDANKRIGDAGTTFLIPGGSDATNGKANIGGSGDNTSGWTITSGSTFGVTVNGSMYCTSGKIAGWNINTTWLSYGTFADDDAASVFLIPGGSAATANIGGYGSNVSGWVITSRNTFGVNANGGMYCTSGKIGGWEIDADSIRSYPKASTSAGAITLSTTNFTRTLITHGSVQNLRFAVGNRFGINQNGVLYADSVVLSGDITATAGSIGNWKISDGQLSYIANSTDTIGASGSAFLIPGGSTTAVSIGGSPSTTTGWTFTSGDNFGVTNTGAMYSTSGKIGGMTIDFGGIFTGTPRDATNGINDTGVYLGSTGISRWIGGVYKDGVRTGGNIVNGLRLAIGENFAVNGSGYSWMSNVYAEKITAYRTYSIYGELPTTFSASDGYEPIGFEFVRAAAARKNNKSFRDIGIGTNFLEEADTPWQNVKPEIGISITRDAVSSDDYTYSYVNIHGQFINFAGPNNGSTTVSQTAVTVQGGLTAINGRVSSGLGLYSTFGVYGGAPSADVGTGWAATCVQSLSGDTEYNLTSNHCYLLTTWHPTNNGNRSMWLLRGGVAAYTKITMQDGSNNTSGLNIVLTVTSSTVKVTSSNNASIAIRLIDLG